jgi:predicted TIM-barrel fold metal-dependent hydrolase
MSMPIVDAQVHIWGADTPERPWPAGNAHRAHRPLPFSKDDLLAEMAAAGVDRAVIVPPSWRATATTSRLRRRRRIPTSSR